MAMVKRQIKEGDRHVSETKYVPTVRRGEEPEAKGAGAVRRRARAEEGDGGRSESERKGGKRKRNDGCERGTEASEGVNRMIVSMDGHAGQARQTNDELLSDLFKHGEGSWV